jgi:hypothetical protein
MCTATHTVFFKGYIRPKSLFSQAKKTGSVSFLLDWLPKPKKKKNTRSFFQATATSRQKLPSTDPMASAPMGESIADRRPRPNTDLKCVLPAEPTRHPVQNTPTLLTNSTAYTFSYFEPSYRFKKERDAAAARRVSKVGKAIATQSARRNPALPSSQIHFLRGVYFLVFLALLQVQKRNETQQQPAREL